MPATLTDARADVARCAEDLRIARKHRNEAERIYTDRPTTENLQAAEGAQWWADTCLETLCLARENLRAIEEGALEATS